MKSFAKHAACCFAALVTIFYSAPAQKPRYGRRLPVVFTLAGELKNFYEISSLPVYRDGSAESEISSWDTTGGNDDGFSGKYSFISRNKDSSLVLADIRGAGVINRIWTPTPTEDTIDFFIDNDRQPTLSVKYEDLFSGRVFPFIAPLCGNQLGGYYCYFPLLFQKSCRIVSRGKRMQFHQIQYRLYPEKSRVQAFTMEEARQNAQVLDSIDHLWNAGRAGKADFFRASKKTTGIKAADLVIRPGEQKTLFSLTAGGRILGIEFYLDALHTEFNKNIDLQIYWDNDRQPAVDCPLADFFGYFFGKPAMESLLLGSQGQVRYCYFPMPFNSKASVKLHYRGGDTLLPVLAVKAKIYYTTQKRDSLTEGRFYTSWNSKTSNAGDGPHVFLNTTGKGHYVGTILQARGLHPGMTYFFEGDDSTSTDNIFRMHGTGSEDYFNGGWYAFQDRWDAQMSLPIHGCLGYSLAFSRTGGYRFYLNDKIPFKKNIFHSIEHGPVQNETPVAYTSLAMYYGNAPVSQWTEPNRKQTDVPVPDTLIIYPQLANFNIWEGIQVSFENDYPTGGSNFLFTVTDASRLRIPLETIPEGNYDVFLDFGKIPEGCSFSLWQRQNQISEWISSASPEKQRSGAHYLGNIQITESRKTISFRFRTGEKKTGFYLNRVLLVKKLKIKK